MTRKIKFFVVALLIGLITNTGFGQDFDLKKYRVKFGLSTTKQADGSRLLNVEFIATNKKDRKDKLPVYDATIDFYNILNDEEVKLGSAKTDKEGTAQLTLPKEQKYVKDSLGYINLKAVFEGSGKMKSKDDELAVKDIHLDLNLEEIDSIKTVMLRAFTLDSLGNKEATNADVIFSVGGMISNMPIKEATTKKGKYEFEFPENIKGNADGNVEVFAKIDESDEFGTVFQKQTVNWGTSLEEKESENYQLWTEAAPIWMYVVLTILLLGVWANYIYTIVNLFKIKKEGQ